MKTANKTKIELLKEMKNLEARLRETEEALRTTQKKNEELLASGRLARVEAENERRRLEAVMEALPVGISITDAQGGNIRANNAFERVWGSPRPPAQDVSDYAAYKAWWEDTGQPVKPEEWASARAAQKGETVVGQLMQIERFDGTRGIVLNSAAPVLDARGQIIGSAVAIQDITDLRKTEQALRESESKYRSLFSNMASGFAYHKVLYDDKGRPNDYVFLEVNEAFEKLTGLKKENVIGRKVTEALPGIEHDLTNWIGTYGNVVMTGQPVRFEAYAEALRKWYSISAYSPEKGYFAAVFEDITERKQAEQDKQKLLTAVQQEKERLSALAMEKMSLIDALRKSRDELEIRVQERTAALAKANEELRAEIIERKRTEEALRKLTDDLNERLKEINCLYSISYYVDKQYLPLDEKFKHIVNIIPSGWQFGELTCARIVLEGKEYKTENFRETPWKQWTDIIVHGEKIGMVEVFYLEKEPEDYEGPFLKEERTLINTIAVELGEMIAHMRADEAFKVERQRFNDVLEMLPAYLILLMPDYHVSFANRFFRERFGELQGQRCFESLFRRSEPCEICETYTVLKTNAPHHWEWTGPDGRIYDIYDFPFTDTDGSPLIMEMGIDITERKRAEEALRAAQQYNRSLIEVTLDPLVTISPEGKITDVNTATEQVTGFPRKELIGTDFSNYFTEPNKAREGYQQAFSKGSVKDYPLAIRHTSGKVTDVLYNATVYKNEIGEIQGVFAAARDITELKETQDELRAASLYTRSLIEASLDPLVTISPDGKIMDVNSATELTTGVSRYELIGTDFSDYFTEPDKAREGYQRVFKEGLVRDYPLAIRHTSGKVTDVLYHATVFRNEAGQIQGVFAAARDITVRRRVEKALRESESRLRVLSAQLLTAQESERKRIAAELHDSVGQMLTAIKFKVENTLQEKGKGAARAKEKSFEAIVPLVKETIEEVRRMQMDLHPSTLDDLGVLATLGWFCREYQKIYSHIRIDKEITIQENEVSVPLKVVLYRLTQEAMNNIAKHSQADFVLLSLRKQENKIEWTVEDNGMGFDLESILSSEGSKRGMGLSSMRERAQLSGGTFTIESTPGKGTTVRASWSL